MSSRIGSRFLKAAPSVVVGLGLSIAAAGPAGAEELFVDVAGEAGLDFVHFNGMSGELYFSEMMGSGGALVDYDHDGDLDVYLVQGAMLGRDKTLADATFPPADPGPPVDRLYRNDTAPGADGRPRLAFVDVTRASGLEAPGYGMGVASGDYDGDGWVDLYVTNAGANQLFRNRGDGTFEDVTARTGTGDRGWGVSAAFVDFDGDDLLDIYVGNYVEYRIATDKECVSQTGARDYCGPLAYEPQADRLYRNRGDGTFEDVSLRSGVAAEPAGALGVVSSDFNGDGRMDFYVANDQVPNKLWINAGDGTFVDEALLAGCAVNDEGQPEASMGLVVGDVDGDGDDDLFMAHLTRETNTLYLNDGSGLFLDSTSDSGLGLPSWSATGFGVALFDYDRDGWLDLFIANGAVKFLEELARLGDPLPLDQPNQLFRNLGGGRFGEVSAAAGEVMALVEVSRGAVAGDVDNDGDPDLLLTNNAGPARLLDNRTPGAPRWLGLRLSSPAGAPLPGAAVTLFRGDGRALHSRTATDGSYASARDPRLLFGLGSSEAVTRLRVRWPRGEALEWLDPPVDRYVTLVAPVRGQGP